MTVTLTLTDDQARLVSQSLVGGAKRVSEALDRGFIAPQAKDEAVANVATMSAVAMNIDTQLDANTEPEETEGEADAGALAEVEFTATENDDPDTD